MTIKSAPYFWAECDRCGESAAQGDYSAWRDPDSAEIEADGGDWYCEGGNHVCDQCMPHPPDWDDEHEACYEGKAELDCLYCRPRAEEKSND